MAISNDVFNDDDDKKEKVPTSEKKKLKDDTYELCYDF